MQKENISQLSKDDLGLENFVRLNDKALSISIRQLLQNWRQGTVGCKGRADVNYANRKPWKQKGTGRARAGSARSPIWRGGGVTFGPQPRVHTIKVNKKLKTGVFAGLLSQLLQDKNLFCIDWELKESKPKTAEAFNLLKTLDVLNKKVLVLLPNGDALHYRSFMNISQVSVIHLDEMNAYDLALSDVIIILKKDFDSFKQVVSSWL